MNTGISLNLSLSFHLRRKNIEEAKLVLSLMSIPEIEESLSSVKKFLTNKKYKRAFCQRYNMKYGQMEPIVFLETKFELLSNQLLSLKNSK